MKFEIGSLIQELSFIDCFAFSSGGHLVHWGKTVLAILVVSHPSNIPVKFN